MISFMRTYELTLVLPKGISGSKRKDLQEKLEKIIKALKGSIKEVKEWGELELAYPIRGESSAFFLHYLLELEGNSAKSISGKLRLEDDIIRYLLVRRK